MKTIFTQKNTGVQAGHEIEAEFFEIEGVYLRINYAVKKEDLEAGKIPYQRDIKIEVSDDLKAKLLEIHNEAKEIK